MKFNKYTVSTILLFCLAVSTLCQTDTQSDDQQVAASNDTDLTTMIGYDDSDDDTTATIEAPSDDNNSTQTGYIDGSIDDIASNSTVEGSNSTDSGLFLNSIYQPTSSLNTNQPLLTSGINSSPSSISSGSVSQIFQPTSPQKYQVGQYVFQVLGSGLPVVAAYLDKNDIVFHGCNVISIPYLAHTDGSFRASSSVPQSTKNCHMNVDNQLINAVHSANGFRRSNNGFYFTKGGKQTIQFRGPIRYAQRRPSRAFINNFPQGNYQMNIIGSGLPSMNALVGGKGFSFQGCNSYAMLCSSTGNGGFRSGNVVSGSKRQCQHNNDQKYLQAIRGGNSYVSEGKNFYLNQNGRRIASFTLTQPSSYRRMNYNFNSKFNALMGGFSGRQMGGQLRGGAQMRSFGSGQSMGHTMSQGMMGGMRQMNMGGSGQISGMIKQQMNGMMQMSGMMKQMGQMMQMGGMRKMGGGQMDGSSFMRARNTGSMGENMSNKIGRK